MTYEDFLDNKAQSGGMHGFTPLFTPAKAFDFQQSLLDWSLRKGRAEIAADCGLGKTLIQLAWAENVVRHTNQPVALLTPIAVGRQTVREAEKFNISLDKVTICNYERIHQLDAGNFAGIVCDESSILKDAKGKTRAAVTDFARKLPYRLLCTATAAPNDYTELGTSSEALGELGYQDMLTKFFKQVDADQYLAWGRLKYRLREYAARDFWRWVCSWMRACRKPSDVGPFSDKRFRLPELLHRETVVDSLVKRAGFLFDLPAESLEDQREDLRRTLTERCETAAASAQANGKSVLWCTLNDEGALLERLLPKGQVVHVSGADSEEAKEEKLTLFSTGQVPYIVTKPSIAGFGLNWQHCDHMTFFPSHSFEQYYQSVRRCWRFGQQSPVLVHLITTEGQGRVLANLQRKSAAADAMFDSLVSLMNNELKIKARVDMDRKMETPSWM